MAEPTQQCFYTYKKEKINYYNPTYDGYNSFELNLEKRIFSFNVRSNLNNFSCKTKERKDIFSFQIYTSKSYIVKISVDTTIYRRND